LIIAVKLLIAGMVAKFMAYWQLFLHYNIYIFQTHILLLR